MSSWIVPASAARLLLGGELAVFCLGDWGAGSKGFVLLGGPFWSWAWGQPEPWSLKEQLVSLPSQTCLALAPLPAEHLIPEWAWEMGPLSEPASIGLPDPLKAGEDPKHGDFWYRRREG